MPLAPPAPPVIPPPLAVPARPAPVPAPIEIAADAPGTASRTEEGWRITFGPGSSVLNPATAQALRDLARGLPAQASVTVAAYAPGTPEDPSTARRLSLARALAVRGMLIAEGIASPRILVRALGASAPISAGPPDRADLVASTAPQPRPAP
jgi:outer membrane protein OmpA-like peptidoglycan-associated protein